MKKTLLSLLAVVGMTLTGSASAQFSKPESAVRYRQAAMTLTENHLIRINTQLKAANPDLKAIESSAALAETLSKLQFEGFIPGTESIGNTKAKPEVFKNTAKFKEYADKEQAEISKLAVVAKGGDVKAIRAQFGEVGKACKTCHDDFRKE